MNKRKFIGRAAAALLILALVGCSGEKHIISYETGTGTAVADQSPTIAAEDISAVILLTDNPDNGACMSAAHNEAFLSAAAELGIETNSIFAPSTEDIDSLTIDYNVIFGAGYDFMNPLDAAAKNNPDKLYACFGGYKYNSTNYSNYYNAIYEAQYLAGIAAGSNSESGKIGIISEYSSEYPDSAAEINSFAIGAKAANPEVSIMVCSLGSRVNTDNAEKYTNKLISEGCDIISIQCDTDIPAKTAVSGGISFVGYGIDMKSIGDECLTSVVWNLKDYYKSALAAAIDGTWTANNYYGTLTDGAVSLSELSETADPITKARIDSASELIKGDLLEIFSNRKVIFDSAGKASVTNAALIDNKSNVMISEDGTAYFIYSGDELRAIEPSSVTSDKLASANMNYLVEGVTVLK